MRGGTLTASRNRSDERAPAGGPSDPYGLLALSIYLAISLFLFGRSLVGHFSDTHIAMGPDPSLFMWFLVWWPHALIHRLNPFFTDLIWSPTGFNLAWTTGVPLPSFLVWPLTAIAGPVAAFNVLCLTGPPTAAWAAFLLCRYACRAWWPSLLGGYIYGFSAYMLGQQSCGHLHMTLVFLVPLAILVVARAIKGELTPRKFVVALTGILVAQFLISIEIVATMTAVGGIVLLLGWLFAPTDTAERIVKTLMPTAIAYALATAILGPYIYCLFALGAPHGPIWPPETYWSDVLNFLVPAPTSELGVIPMFERLSAPFRTDGIAEAGAYMGLPLIILFVAYSRRHGREPMGRLLVDSFVITCVLALGPHLHIHGVALCRFPGAILLLVPPLDKALATRFTMYAFLIMAIIASRWFASSRSRAGIKLALAAAVVLFTLPNLSAHYWTRPARSPEFFTGGLYRQYLAPNEKILLLPFGVRGNSMLWQAEAGMYFRMVGGWTGVIPKEFHYWPIVDAFQRAVYLPDPLAQLNAFMSHNRVDAVVVTDDDPEAKFWDGLLAHSSTAMRSVGGVALYQISPTALKPYDQVTALEMAQRTDSVVFDTLLLAADRWLSDGQSLARLTPFEAERQHLLGALRRTGPTILPGWLTGGNDTVMNSTKNSYCGAWLGQAADGRPGLGLYGTYAVLEPIMRRYQQDAVHIYFPYPHDLLSAGATLPRPDAHSSMLVVFDRDQLAAAAARIRASGSATLASRSK